MMSTHNVFYGVPQKLKSLNLTMEPFKCGTVALNMECKYYKDTSHCLQVGNGIQA